MSSSMERMMLGRNYSQLGSTFIQISFFSSYRNIEYLVHVKSGGCQCDFFCATSSRGLRDIDSPAALDELEILLQCGEQCHLSIKVRFRVTFLLIMIQKTLTSWSCSVRVATSGTSIPKSDRSSCLIMQSSPLTRDCRNKRTCERGIIQEEINHVAPLRKGTGKVNYA